MELLTHKEVRTNTRLRTERGIVFLRAPGVPSLACGLSDFSEQGCRCVVSLNNLHPETANQWQSLLEPGRRLGTDLSAPPHLPGLHLEAQVRHVDRSEGTEITLGLCFDEVEAEERGLIKKALLSLAAAKLRPSRFRISTVPEPAGEACGVLAPAPILHRGDPFRGRRVGEILVMLGKLTQEEADAAEAAARQNHERIGHYLLRRSFVTPLDLCGALSLQTGLPMIDLSSVAVAPALVSGFSYLTMLKHNFIPFEGVGETVAIAATHPLSPRVMQELEQRSGKKIQVYLAEDDQVTQRLHALQPAQQRKHRRNTRYELSVPVSFQVSDRRRRVFNQPLHDGQLVNVGESGLAFRTAEDLQRRDVCLKVCFSLTSHMVEGVYGVRYIRNAEDKRTPDLPFLVGLELLEMSTEQRSRLREICIQVGLAKAKDARRRSF